MPVKRYGLVIPKGATVERFDAPGPANARAKELRALGYILPGGGAQDTRALKTGKYVLFHHANSWWIGFIAHRAEVGTVPAGCVHQFQRDKYKAYRIYILKPGGGYRWKGKSKRNLDRLFVYCNLCGLWAEGVPRG